MTSAEFPELRCSGLLASLGNRLASDRLRGDSSKYRQDHRSWESQGGELENSVLPSRLSSLLTLGIKNGLQGQPAVGDFKGRSLWVEADLARQGERFFEKERKD